MFGLVNHDSKALYVAVKSLEKKVKENEGTNYNCLVFNPLFDKKHSTAMSQYSDFFKDARDVKMLPVITEQGPGELAGCLEKDYKAHRGMWVGGMTSPLTVPKKSVDKLVRDLTENPLKYFVSEEKKVFR
jgi:hypothetical protein